MFSVNWKRPADVPFPQVWRRFEKITKDGKTLKFKIQDITEDMHDEIEEFMCKQYLTGEKWNSSCGCDKDPVFIEIMKGYMKQYIFPQKVALMCLLDDEEVDSMADGKTKTLVGVNLTGVCDRDEKEDYEGLAITESAMKLLSIYNVVKQQSPNPYEKYKVAKLMNSMGLCVHPDFRGMSISKEILLCRIPLCKAIGVPLTNTIFTATVSQVVAARAGFQEDSAIPYPGLEEAVGFPINTTDEVAKVMSLPIQ